MAQDPKGATLRKYLTVFRRNWWIFLATMLLGGVSGFVYSTTQEPIFEAQASGIVVSASESKDTGSSLAADSLAKSKATSYVSIATSQMVARDVKEALASNLSEGALLGSVTVVAPNATNIVSVTAKADTPQQARDLAKTWVESTSNVAAEVDSDRSVALKPLGAPALPTAPVSPNVKLMVAAGIGVGLVLSLGLAIGRFLFDRRIRSRQSVMDMGSPVIAAIPFEKKLRKERGKSGRIGVHLSFGFDESIRELRTNLSFVDVDHPPRVLLITSAAPGEGKSSVSANLAAAMAATGSTVIIADVDLRRPTVADTFGLRKTPGLTDVLSGRAGLDETLQEVEGTANLWALPAGRIPPNPSELLGSQSMQTLIRELSEHAILILDAPPVLPVTDAVVLSKFADATIVVIGAGKTTVDQLQRALTSLETVGSKAAGLVLNRVPSRGAGASDYEYYSAAAYAPTDQSQSQGQGQRRSAHTAERSRNLATTGSRARRKSTD